MTSHPLASRHGPALPAAARAWAAVVLRCAVLAAAAALLASLHLRRPATLCPLRALTGLPCPLCGGTTAAVRAGRLDVTGALRANPLAVGGAALLAVAPLGLRERWERYPPRTRRLVGAGLLATGEVWQLLRLGWSPG